MSSIQTTKFFKTADIALGKSVVGADFTMVFRSYPLLTFNIKTNGLPMLKNEKIERSTTHGIKTNEVGYIQTLNDIPVTFGERESLVVKKIIEEIILSGNNGEEVIDFYMGRTVSDTRMWGSLEFASLHIEDSPEADAEATTSPFTITATVSGHYVPPKVDLTGIDLTKGILGAF